MTIEWIDLPARRIGKIAGDEMRREFQLVNQGEPIGNGETIYRVIRNKDNKVFKLSEFVPAHPGDWIYFYLEEI